MKRRAIITDLDGTLLSGNSMRIFMKNLPSLLMKKKAYSDAFKSLWWIGMRSIRLVSHKTMKWHLAEIARRNLSASDWNGLAEKMAEFVNPVVKDIIESRQRELSGNPGITGEKESAVVIASAAMEDYVKPLCRIMGYDNYIATEFTPLKFDYEEMRGESKLRAIRELLESEDLQLDTFLTDHYDDCPTVEAFPGETIIVNPSERHEALFREIGVTRFCHVSRRDGSCR